MDAQLQKQRQILLDSYWSTEATSSSAKISATPAVSIATLQLILLLIFFSSLLFSSLLSFISFFSFHLCLELAYLFSFLLCLDPFLTLSLAVSFFWISMSILYRASVHLLRKTLNQPNFVDICWVLICHLLIYFVSWFVSWLYLNRGDALLHGFIYFAFFLIYWFVV